MNVQTKSFKLSALARVASVLLGMAAAVSAVHADLAQSPLFVTASQPPLVLLTMSRDHKLYYEAYNDYSDINGDGEIDVGYKPAIDYYGYFDSYKCYDYVSGVFTPVAVNTNKKCTGSNDAYWSGDFLNYVTTSRMDALRKVFYGGYRSTDTATQTILERVFIPQDAHSWGKEYHSVANDGYDITEYTPLSLPATGTRHLFANVTLTSDTSPPLMRVLTNSSFRIWEWVSIERPVAGVQCATGANVRTNCASSSGWAVVPASTTAGLSGLTRKVYDTQGSSSHPNTQTEFDTLEATYGVVGKLCGTDSPTTINQSGNPFAGAGSCGAGSDNYMTIITGTLNVPTSTTYTFGVDGDDAVDVVINGTLVASWYGGHGTSSDFSQHQGSITLSAGSYSIKFRHEEVGGGDSYKLGMSAPASVMTDYTVRVEVCKTISGEGASTNFGREANCQSYGAGTPSYKPTGLLHKYGQADGMYFGLLTGSYDQNTNGGILRKAMGSITNEIEASTGIYKESGATCGVNGDATCVKGIVGTINRLKITSFNYSNQSYSCGWITTSQMTDGQCEMWGNPLAEMMYEGLRYFSGQTAATSSFTTSSTRDDALGLPRITNWSSINPFTDTIPPESGRFPRCSRPYFMLVSDVYPSFDSDSLPGKNSNFGSAFGGTSTFNGNTLNVSTQGQSIWNMEFGAGTTKNVFIGQNGATYDGAPTVKAASSLGTLRGLAPSDPTRQGSFYSGSVAYFSHINDISSVSGSQKLSTYSIALSAPLPVIEIPIPSTTNKIKFVPFAKSVGGSSISAASGSFQPTNQIVDFYVDTIANTTAGNSNAAINGGRPYYKFRINFEDVEQGADHDMDAISTYEIKLNADNTVTVNMSSDYAAGGIIQHMGYVASGTTADGVFLEVRDLDTGAGSDPDYFLDTPNTASVALPLTSTRTFTASSSASTGEILKDPLWFAAKYGGFTDANSNGIPDNAAASTVSEWDADGDGVPDNYYLVVNPTKLETQLNAALNKIKDTSGTAAALSTNSYTLQTGTVVFQSLFNSDGWSGELNAYPIANGSIGAAQWQAQTALVSKSASTRVIMTFDHENTTNYGVPFRWNSMTVGGALQTTLNKLASGTVDSKGSARVNFLRGDEDSTMRTRPKIPGTTSINKLGDIVGSQAQYVSYPNLGYSDTSYASFRSTYKTRTPMVYVGANDGMLHGFHAETGEELLGYVPNELYRVRGGKQLLSKLTQSDYGKSNNPHRYYVDGTPTMADICTGTCSAASDWKTILVGGLNGGGQGLYALDITNPGNFTEANAASIVKWEFQDHDFNVGTLVHGDADLGYTYSRPYVVKLCTSRATGTAPAFPSVKQCNASKWYVVFGNGYNNTEADGYASTSGDAALYVLDADTGDLVKKINVKKGNTTTPNGLSEVAPIDVDADGVADYIYAGDVKGNMWRFDVYDDAVTNWGIPFGTAAAPAPLYTAKDEASTPVAQPITSAPDVILHPNGGMLVTFGTGSYLYDTDPASTQVQTLYGIWDKNAPVTTGRTELVGQSINTGIVVSASTTVNIQGTDKTISNDYRAVSANSVDWATKLGWYLNLPDTGERIAYGPEIRGGKVVRVTSVVPSVDICSAGGYSWEYFVDALTGGNLGNSPFLAITTALTPGGSNYASAVKSAVGITPPGSILSGSGASNSIEIMCGSTGECQMLKLKEGETGAGRVSWREILGQ